MYGEGVMLGESVRSGLAKYAVIVEAPQVAGVIGLGPITGHITRAWVEYGGQEVTEVPEGENFVVKVSYEAQNLGFRATPLDPAWSTSVTAISTDGEVGSYNSNMHMSASVSQVKAVGLGPMPAHDITLRVKLWGNQAVWTMPGVPDTAPENQW